MSSTREQRECSEIKIKVPWGHLAGKWWGSKASRPILALHGGIDSAGTFDTLIPLLPVHYSFLAIDLPGHGHSSFLPEGMTYHVIDFVNVILRIMNEMKWDKVSLLGHSMGAVLSLLFTGIFPDKVDFLIAIDTLKMPQFPKESYWSALAYTITSAIMGDERNKSDEEPPSYTFDECIERMYTATGSVDRSKCRYILARNVRQSKKYPEKYFFSRDGRLKRMNIGMWPHEFYIELAHRIHVPHVFIKALDARNNQPLENYQEMISTFKKNPQFEYHEVRGSHHVHLNEPENVGGIIRSFLRKYCKQEEPVFTAKL